MGYEASILRVNRQIYGEATGIFYLENFWIVVWVNKAGFGKAMKDSGFPVAAAGDLWRHIRSPVMEVAITFPSLKDQKQNDFFVLASIHLKHLMRVLWTAKGSAEIEVMIQIKPPLTSKTPSKTDLLKPFFKLRRVNNITVLGVSNQKNIDKLKRKITTIDCINQSIDELRARANSLQRYIKAHEWENAVHQAKNLAVLISDCRLVYDERFVGIEPNLGFNASTARGQAAKEILITTAVSIAEVAIYLSQYENATRFASCALRNLSRSAFISRGPSRHASSIVPVYNTASTGTITFADNTKSFIHLLSARAYKGLRSAWLASYHVEKAYECAPNGSLASLTEALEIIFDTTPDLLTASPSSALAILFASTADSMDYCL